MEEIQKHVRSLELGDIQKYRNLAIIPVLGGTSNLEHIALADALGEGFAITEKRGGASVPVLFAENRTGKYVMAIAGEYVVGGMQNRTLVRNSYFDKEFAGDLPVRCVQQGRWHYGSEAIRLPTFPRRSERESEEVPVGAFRSGGHAPLSASICASTQGEVWGGVAHCLVDAGVRDSTGDLSAVYRERKDDFVQYKRHFPIQDGQVGSLAVIKKNGDKIFVLDLFDRPEILRTYHKNLVNSYALEAGIRSNEKVSITKKEARGFLDSVDSCNFESRQPVSVGGDYLISGENLQGAVLLFDNQLAYMNFLTKPRDKQGKNPGTRTDDMRIGGCDFDLGEQGIIRFRGPDWHSGFHRRF